MILPEPVLARIAAAFPASPPADMAPTSGGFSHHSAFATIGAHRCVVKAAALPAKRADLRREAAVLRLLAGRGLPAPTLLALLDDAEWTIALTLARPGAPGVALYAAPLAERYAAVGALAELLAQVHQAALPPPTPDLLLAARARQALLRLPELGLPAALRDALAAGLSHPAWYAGAALVHGDAGAHNLLWHPHSATLLDWEWAGWGSPQIDLAWVGWTLRWRAAGELWPHFAERYRAGNPAAPHASPADARALAIGQIGCILARVADQPAAFAEWLRRAEWTLDGGAFV